MPMSAARRLVGMVARRMLVGVVLVNLLVPFWFGWPSRRDAEPARAANFATTQAATRHYLALRDPTIDRILPEGAGGTRIVDVLPDDVDGVARADRGLIEVALAAVGDSTPRGSARRGDIVEIHERAHLLDAAAPDLVDELIARLPPPDPDSYAATNDGEHFAEILANAWEILALQRVEGLCIDFAGALEHTERRIPGTAGAVLMLRPNWEVAHGPVDTALARVASSLAVGTTERWRAIAAMVERRRQGDGRLTRWPIPTLRHRLLAVRRQLLRGPGLHDRALGWVLTPSALVAAWVSATTQVG